MKNRPQLETKRLILGEVFATDIPQIIEYAGNNNIAKNTLNIPHPYEEKDALFWLNSIHQGLKNQTQFTFGIRLKPADNFIGGIGLKVDKFHNKAEMGYWVAEPFWNKGLMTEAAEAVLAFGFNTLHLNKIFATHLIENPGSGKVMIKNGMIKEGELIDHFKRDGEYKSVIQYRLTKQEYEMKNK